MAKRILSTVLLWSIVFATLWFFRTTGAVLLTALLSVLTLGHLRLVLRDDAGQIHRE